MNALRALLEWLRAPFPRVPGAPLRFRRKLSATHHQTDRYEGSLTTADRLLSAPARTLPALVYHDTRFTWRGCDYRVYWQDAERTYAFRPGQSVPVWLDPADLSTVWLMSQERPTGPVPIDMDEEDDLDEGLLMAVDVHYTADQSARAAAVLFNDWHRGDPAVELTSDISPVAAYESGAFYKRELPCILNLIDKLDALPSVILIDGYVTLGADGRDGLGMHLFRALGEKIPVIGVAKSRFDGTPEACELLRGQSKQPLLITAAGMSLDDAKACVAGMHGPYRLPTLLTRVDRLARDGLTSADCPSTHAD